MPYLEDVVDGWERNKARTRVSLATAAVRLFREQGYEATTVDDIARAAGSSSSTFFRYFGTKEDVLFFNIREVLDTFRAFVEHPIPGLSRWDQIHLGVVAAVRQVADPSPEIEEASIVSWLREPAISRRFSGFSRELETVMASALAAERGVDPDSDLMVQVVARSATAAYMSAFHVHVHTGQDLPKLLDQAFCAVQGGITGPAGSR
jgi:AcrR family transcriptional regulator